MTSGPCRTITPRLLGAMGGLLLSATAASAQEPGGMLHGWSFTLSPYVWFAGLDGDLSTPAGQQSFSAEFGDIFETLKFSAMGLAEARRGRFSLVADTLYLNLQQGVPVPGPHGAFSGGSARTQSFEFSAIGLYTLVERQTGRLEFGGGLRAWWFKTEISFSPGLLPGRSADSTTSWVDPILATRGVLRLGESLAFTVYGDIGGFGVGSEQTWQAIGTLDWQVTRSLSAAIGYRHIHIDYERGRSTIALDLSGPIIGASYRF